jgi:hypothetical protein
MLHDAHIDVNGTWIGRLAQTRPAAMSAVGVADVPYSSIFLRFDHICREVSSEGPVRNLLAPADSIALTLGHSCFRML